MANQLSTIILPAPAKINLFLHIVGRRSDGYHNLQTVFQFLDYGDTLTFTHQPDETIHLSPNLPDVAPEDNLIVKAALLLKKYAQCPLGANIQLEKRIPMGSGLGGGSSDAATTLVALNKLWNLNLPQQTLMTLGKQLGADVPIFIYQHAAFAQGIGDEVTPVEPPTPWYAILVPQVHVSTIAMYKHPDLSRDTPLITVADYLSGAPCHNDFSPLVFEQYPAIKNVADWLAQFGCVRLTGSGAGLFVACQNQQQAQDIIGQIPSAVVGFAAQGQNHSPLKTVLMRDYQSVVM